MRAVWPRRYRHSPIAPLLVAPLFMLWASAANAATPSGSGLNPQLCRSLMTRSLSGAPVVGLRLASAQWHEAGLTLPTRDGPSAPLPAHCEIEGQYAKHVGVAGGTYHTGFRMRLPQAWNGRFLFQGGGGSNGVIGDATGFNGPGNRLALTRGYAVISQDSGHDNAINVDPARGGDLVFGHDPVARANYGHASLKPSYDLGLYLIKAAYGRKAKTKLFWGCSKGGQEGMAFAQRYPTAFDGIVAMSPGFALPRAAVAETWDVQQFASILRANGAPITPEGLKTAIRPEQFKIVSDTVTKVCDGDDGALDGMIGAIGLCTSKRVLPELRKRQCSAGISSNCLQAVQIDALGRVMDGAKDSAGRALYSPWPWDNGIGQPGWAVWKIGLVNGPPAINISIGAGSLAAVFTTPPTALPTDPAALLAWQMAFDFDHDASRIYSVTSPYRTSAWTDVGMRSTDLTAFRAHGGKLIVPHGMSDPVFSALDTINWWNAVNARSRGQAANFARVFPVPGMNHCSGGPATDRFDSLAALEDWVIKGDAPEMIPATAGPATPWPGRERPLCAYPEIARPAGAGRFVCRKGA